jgi:flagellar biosynthesis/type III secretory pathway chaperone
MSDSFENLMNSRFDKITAEEKKIQIQQITPEKEDLLSALGSNLSRRLTKKFTSESSGNVQNSDSY